MNSIKRELDIREVWTQSIIDAVAATFATLTGQMPKPGPAIIDEDMQVYGDVSGIINLVQDQAVGVLVVSFPKDTIFYTLAKIYGKQISKVNQSVQDGVGEFTNIIYGRVKAHLNENGHAFKMALPSVVMGSSHTIVNPRSKNSLMIPFEISGFPFHVSVQIHTASGSGDAPTR